MTPHDWYVEHRVDYVARTLEASEEQSFADHLVRCAECRDAVAALERELAWLPMGVRPVRPRPGLRRQIVQQVLGETRPRRGHWLAPIAVAAAAVLLMAIFHPGRREARELRVALSERSQELAALRDSLSIMQRAARVLQAQISMDGHEGGMLIFADTVSHRWNVVVHGLPPAPPGETYQFWFIAADGMVKSVAVNPDPARPAIFTLEMPKEGGEVMGAALTMESMTNTSPEPRGKELAHLML
jgi:hypothetical protein